MKALCLEMRSKLFVALLPLLLLSFRALLVVLVCVMNGNLLSLYVEEKRGVFVVWRRFPTKNNIYRNGCSP